MMEDKTRYNLIPKNVLNLNEKSITKITPSPTVNLVISEIASWISQAC